MIVVPAGVYVRISRDREGLEAGVERQEADCRALAAARGWTVAAVYSDNDVRATDRRKVRRAYRRMLDDLREGRIDAVVAHSSSRLYRRARDLEELVDLIEARRAEVATAASGRIDLTTADGRMLARILASVDQAEAERIGERSTRAKAELKKSGAWLGGGARAFGYERLKDARGKTTHRIDEAEAGVLHEAARRALAGESLNQIALDLNARGITTSAGGRWQPSRLRQTLTSPLHAGRFADGTRGNWPAIFSDDEHLLLRARFPQPTGPGRPRASRAYILSGLLHCSECGRKLLGSGGAYRCMPRNGGCTRVRVAAWPVDLYVWDAAFARDEVRAAEPEPASAAGVGGAYEGLVAELRAVEARQLEAREAYAAGELSLADFKGISDAVARRASGVEARIREQVHPPAGIDFAKIARWADVEGRIRRRELAPDEVAEIHDWLGDWIERITVTPALRRGRKAIEDVPARVHIEWRG